jgi:hypothetical protein
LIPPSSLLPPLDEDDKERQYETVMNSNGNQLALVGSDVIAIYNMSDILAMKPSRAKKHSSTHQQRNGDSDDNDSNGGDDTDDESLSVSKQPSVRVIAKKWLKGENESLLWLNSHWIHTTWDDDGANATTILYTLMGKPLIQWNDIYSIIIPRHSEMTIPNPLGYFLLHLSDRHVGGGCLYAYNIASILDAITASQTLSRSAPSLSGNGIDGGEFGSIASWPVGNMSHVTWLLLPTDSSDGMIAIRSGKGTIRVYSVPMYSSSTTTSTSTSTSPSRHSINTSSVEEEIKEGMIGSTKLYEWDNNQPIDRIVSVTSQYNYNGHDSIVEWVTIALMSQEVGWTLTPLVALVLSYLL